MARLVVDRWLLQRRPAPDLADWLVCVWRGDLGEAATPLPDERLDLVWVDDGSLWLSGPETSSWSRGYRPGTTAVGVGFKPAVGPPMLDLAAAEVRDARIRLDTGELIHVDGGFHAMGADVMTPEQQAKAAAEDDSA